VQEVLERPLLAPVETGRGSLRGDLLDQIARLERELAALFCSSYPRKGFDFGVASRGGGPRLLRVSELEELRDDLADRLRDTRLRLGERAYVEQLNRQRIEAMLQAPEEHKWVVVGNEDIGEKGCRHWHSRPRMGLIGMLMGWWRVVISSGCPLAQGRGVEPAPRQ
jgi:hypothetical protein